MRDIGIQIRTHNIVVDGQISPVYLLLNINDYYTKQSNLELFIPWSGLPVAMTHGAFLGMKDEIIYFILFLLTRLCLYMLRCVNLPCGRH